MFNQACNSEFKCVNSSLIRVDKHFEFICNADVYLMQLIVYMYVTVSIMVC